MKGSPLGRSRHQKAVDDHRAENFSCMHGPCLRSTLRAVGGTVAAAGGALRPSDRHHVYRDVHRDYRHTQRDLDLSGQALGIQCRGDVALDESASVTHLSRPHPQVHLQRRERADPSREFHPGPPKRAWDVDPGGARPAQDQQTPQNDEENEGPVCHEDRICEQAEDHRAASIGLESDVPPTADSDWSLSTKSALKSASSRRRSTSWSAIPPSRERSLSALPNVSRFCCAASMVTRSASRKASATDSRRLSAIAAIAC